MSKSATPIKMDRDAISFLFWIGLSVILTIAKEIFKYGVISLFILEQLEMVTVLQKGLYLKGVILAIILALAAYAANSIHKQKAKDLVKRYNINLDKKTNE